MQKISVVIPARDSQGTIRTTVESLWSQTLRPDEVLIVVGQNDYTAAAIPEYVENGFVTMLVVKSPEDYIRDAQWKRFIGVKASKGDLIFLTDSKVVMEQHALENALRLMMEHDVSVVGGITPAWPNQVKSFWAKLHDGALVSNLPEFPNVGFLTAEDFGKTESLPVTTALLFKRCVFDAVSDDFALEFSKVASTYDDYVLAWLIAQAGYTILITNQVVAHHLHRTSWSGYSMQISRSGQSAAVMAKMYPDCPFGKRRLKQVRLITAAGSLLAAFCMFIVFVSHETAIVAGLFLAVIGYVLLGIANIIKAKNWQAFAFPFFTVLLILTFALHFSKTYMSSKMHPSSVQEYLQIH
jgi:cellulose synthase/poly-beta-1,6-N-acetylglucosamine synthase-like glycosyltransferase